MAKVSPPATSTTRGRSTVPGRSPMRAFSTSPSGRIPGFGTQFSFERQPADPSPHIIRDKITRHASPARRTSRKDSEEIVPKIPQPYSTSFSAVTSPYRRQRTSTTDDGTPTGLVRNGPARATMPVKLGQFSSQHAKSEDLLTQSPSPSQVSPTANTGNRHSGSHGDILESVTGNSSRAKQGVESGTFVRNGMHYASTPANLRGRTALSASESRRVKILDDGTDSPDNVFENGSISSPTLSENNVRSFMENTDPEKVLANGGLHSPPYGSSELIVDTVRAKTLIQKEYAHQETVTYFQLLEKQKKKKLVSPNSQTRRFLSFMIKGSKPPQRSHSAERPVKVNHDMYDPDMVRATSRSVEDILNDKTVQSNISLPAEVLSSSKKRQKEQPPVKKSHSSSSIWNVFRRLSPKSFRRSTRSHSVGRSNSKESRHSTPTGSDTSLHLVPVDIEEKGSQDSLQRALSSSRRSWRKSPKLSKKKSKKEKQSGSMDDLLSANTGSKASTSSETSTPQVVSSSSARIMKSIEDNTLASQEKSVYHVFKEKQSPKQPREAASLRPQALRPVEIPDNLLARNGEQSKVPPTRTPTDPKGPRLSSEGAPKSRGANAEPPKTLNVRNTAKKTFYNKSQSEDSIGDCSLDVQTTATGSEPSITSRNSQSKSSTDFSKKTIHSDDAITVNGTTPAKVQVATIKSSDTNPEKHVTTNYVSSRVLSIENGDLNLNTDEVDSHRVIDVSCESPKTPSYLKLSCAISGYNKYSNYNNGPSDITSPTSPSCNNNRRVKRPSQELTPVGADYSVQNGHLENHVRSNGHHFEVEGSRVQQNGSHHENGINGAVDFNGDVNINNKRHSTNSNISHGSVDNRRSMSPVSVRTSLIVVNGVSDRETSGRDGATESLTPTRTEAPRSISTPNKDGAYFLQVTDVQERRLKDLCAQAEHHLQSNIPEEASGRVRAAIGKANLLTSKKFKQFRGLCNQNMSQSESEPFRTTAQDLAGFWDMVLIQVHELNEMFDNLETMRQNGWNSPVKENQTLTSNSATHINKPLSPRGKTTVAKETPAQTPKSSKSKDSSNLSKSRSEARKRLLAAKRAGRQRKASQSDDVEIYVS